LLLEWSCAAKAGGNFFEFEISVANPENSKAIQQKFPLSDNISLLSIAEECESDRAIGNSAIAEEFHRKSGRRRRWRRNFWFRAGLLAFHDLRNHGRRGKFPTENVAAAAPVFRFAGPVERLGAELGIVNAKRTIFMDCRVDAGGYNGPVMIEIEKPDGAGYEQENDEDGELFLLFHAAVLK
jgi:hypothetical protein